MEFPRIAVPELLDNNEPIIFQITDWYIPESDRSRPKNKYDEEQDLYTILMYGVTEKGETVSVNIVDYEPYFYVKAPIEWDDLSYSQYKKRVDILNLQLKNEKYEVKFKDNTYSQKIIPKQYEEHFNNLSIVQKNEFWGFTNNRLFNYIKVSVKSLALFNKLKYYFQSRKKDGFKLYESNIDPFLRYIHEINIKPAGWVKIEDYELNDNQTRCDYNIQINYKNIIPVDINKIAPLDERIPL